MAIMQGPRHILHPIFSNAAAYEKKVYLAS